MISEDTNTIRTFSQEQKHTHAHTLQPTGKQSLKETTKNYLCRARNCDCLTALNQRTRYRERKRQLTYTHTHKKVCGIIFYHFLRVLCFSLSSFFQFTCECVCTPTLDSSLFFVLLLLSLRFLVCVRVFDPEFPFLFPCLSLFFEV